MLIITCHLLDAPWCGHCKSLAPEYAKAATKLAEEKSDILLAKVDATEETELAEKHSIRGYPTLKFFKNGKVIDYNGGRTSEDIIKWLNKKTGPPAEELTTADRAKEFRDSQNVVVVGHFSDKESADYKTFIELAQEVDETLFGLVTDKAIADSLELTKEGVTLFKKFDENRNDFDGEYSLENLKKFITANSLPLVVEFNHEVCLLFTFLAPLIIFCFPICTDCTEDFRWRNQDSQSSFLELFRCQICRHRGIVSFFGQTVQRTSTFCYH